MHWYRSATTDVGFQLKDSTGIVNVLKLKPFETMITDTTGEIVYTLTQQVSLSPTNESMSKVYNAKVIEGKCYTFEVNGSENIYLDNLDSNYRLYFTEENVAENGIFIKRSNDVYYTEFEKVDNIVSYPLGKLVYEFGVLPNSNTCYIQFSEDIATLLGDSNSLQIKYVLSNGTNGNIKNGILNSFLGDITVDNGEEETIVVNDQIKIIQTSPTINGENPESIDDAYTNYKRVAGTFNTLVTRRDYENYLYNAQVNNDYLVSNCVVSDRTCDINCSTNVQVWSPNFNKRELIVAKENDNLSLDAFDIVLYALSAGDGTYDSTFTPNTDTIVASLLQSMVDDVKAVEHDFISPSTLAAIKAIYYLFKNMFALHGQIITYNKVTKEEANEIEQNVKDALMQQYNSRHLTFGEEIDYNRLIKTIQDADTRIKTVALDVPKYAVKRVSDDRDEENHNMVDNLSMAEKLHIVAKMILSGNVQLFKFDESFNYEFGQTEMKHHAANKSVTSQDENTAAIREITTSTDITFNNASPTYTLKENEVIQLYAPNYVVDKEYSVYVKFNFYSNQIQTLTADKTITNVNTILAKGSELAANSVVAMPYRSWVVIFDIGKDSVTVRQPSEDKSNPEDLLMPPSSVLSQIVVTDYFDGRVVSANEGIVGTTNTILKSGTKLTAGSNINGNSIYKIQPDTDYILKPGELIKLKYTDTNNAVVVEDIKAGSVVNISTGVAAIYSADVNSILNKDVESYKNVLASGQSLKLKSKHISTIPNGTKVYWILNNAENKLDLSKDYILSEDEYFIYTNNKTDELIIYGSGTMLSPAGSSFNATIVSPDLTAIENNDIANIKWYELKPEESIIATELDIITIGEGATIRLFDIAIGDSFEVTNEAKDLVSVNGNNLSALINENTEDSVTVSTYPDADGNKPYKIHSRLNLNTAETGEQFLQENQTLKVTYNTLQENNVNYYEETIEGPTYVSFNNPVILSGGVNKDVSVLGEGSVDYSLELYTYNKDSSVEYVRDKGIIKISPEEYDEKTAEQNGWSKSENEYTKELKFDFSNAGKFYWLVQVYVTKSTGKLTVSFYTKKDGTTDTEIFAFNGKPIDKTGSYILKITPDAGSVDSGLYVKFAYEDAVSSAAMKMDTVSIGKINYVNGVNNEEIDVLPDEIKAVKVGKDQLTYNVRVFNKYNETDYFEITDSTDVIDVNENSGSPVSLDQIIEEIDNIIKNSDNPDIQFDWSYRVPNSEKVLQPTASLSYFNTNHYCNRYTIPQIDFSNYDVKVNPYSIK